MHKMSTNSKFFHRKRGKDTDGLPVAYLWLCVMQLADAGACGGVAAPPYLELGTYHTTRSNATLQHTMRRTPSSQPGRRNIATQKAAENSHDPLIFPFSPRAMLETKLDHIFPNLSEPYLKPFEIDKKITPSNLA